MDLGATLAQITATLDRMSPVEVAQFEESLGSEADDIWIPSIGPQYTAFFHPAKELLYGGAGGGGKTDLVLGLAFTQHQDSLILRRQYVDQGGMIERAIEINGTRDGFSGAIPPRLFTSNGRRIVFGAHKELGDEQSFQGQAFDLKAFDEACQHLEAQIKFHLGWLRSTKLDADGRPQRCRAILASNPPLDASGDWIIGRYRPWLDLTHPKPAKHGEIRWFMTTPDGDEIEVDDDTPREFEVNGEIKVYRPNSRTFIPAKLSDNPFLVNTDYGAQQDALPEPLRSAVRDGNFMATRKDAVGQLIPMQWVIEAQARWKKDGWRGKTMTAMGYDPAGGGRDAAELVWRYGFWFSEFVSDKGAATADGSATVAHIVRHRRDDAPVIIDHGGGYAGTTTLRLKDNKIPYIAYNGNTSGVGRDKSGKLKFANHRAEVWWRFMEALDPDQIGGSPVALPDDPELRADLCAPTYKVGKEGVILESKDDIRKRIGRSPGKGDAVVICYAEGETAQQQRAHGDDERRRPLPTHAKSTRSGPLQRRRLR